jgi:hypothetical protein
MSDYYPPNTRVLVVLPRDEYTSYVGTVTATYNDGGDMVHRVRFCTGHHGALCHSAYYEAHELRDARVGLWRAARQAREG